MLNRSYYLLLLVGLVLAPASLAAQQPQPQQGAQPGPPQGDRRGPPNPFDMRPGPVERLLRDRAVIGLTDDQVARLQDIDRRMEQKNHPLVMQLLQIRRQLPPPKPGGPRAFTVEERQAWEAQMRVARPIFDQIQSNNMAAMHEVGDLLTDQQKARIKELITQEHAREQQQRSQDGGRDRRAWPDDRQH